MEANNKMLIIITEKKEKKKIINFMDLWWPEVMSCLGKKYSFTLLNVMRILQLCFESVVLIVMTH